ncbi:B12-binding domain-containing radical SAM protein [Haliangium sp.]|uniref:B12-binding domain-containing radical SAM protein n=1 Tax=Haliangium sp. TaxID=2663208 RepID=UPI003D0F5998
MTEPLPAIRDYYRDYSARFGELLSDYYVPENSLWELPLWVAHLAGMLSEIGFASRFLNLSSSPCDADDLAASIAAETAPGAAVLLSPLAPNFDLTMEVSRRLMAAERVTVLGGNMAALASVDDATHIHQGIITPEKLSELFNSGLVGLSRVPPRRGRGGRVGWQPEYSLLSEYRGQVPLLRLNASHGCLFQCNFCGDAWSRQLYVVEREALEYEVQQFERYFPESRLIYIGDKTFGQSKEAVTNLLEVFADRPGYAFIAQTHVLQVDDAVIDAMRRLGVVVVELGFESADDDLLDAQSKPSRGVRHYSDVIDALTRAGIKVVLNVMGGLVYEQQRSHERTVAFLEAPGSNAWLYNLYNFVPYPLTPLFPRIRDRIYDWSFANWREDSRPVFHPYHMSADESFALFLDKIEVAHRRIGGRLGGPDPVVTRARSERPSELPSTSASI